MSKNRFLEKFKNKSDSELEEIIADNKTYVDEARKAAVELLKFRENQSEDLAICKKEIANKEEPKNGKNVDLINLKNLDVKIKEVYIPFLIVSTGTIVFYYLFRWTFDIKLNILPLKKTY
jgi:hypothetical protein